MKIKIDAKQLKKQLIILKTVTKNNEGLLSCVYVYSSKGQLNMTVTDLEVTVNIELDEKVDVFKPIVVVLSLLLESLKSASSYITLSVGAKVSVMSDTGIFTSLSNNNNYEEWPGLLKNVKVKAVIDAASVYECVRKVFSFIAKDESRFCMNGALFSQNSITSTNDKGVVKVDHNLAFSVDDFICPRNSLNLFLKLFKNVIGKVQISVKNNIVVFKHKGLIIQSQIIEGNFPKVEAVIPEKGANSILFDSNAVIKVLKSCSKSFKQDKLAIISGGMLRSRDGGVSINLNVDLKNDSSIGINIDYFIQMLESANTDRIELEWDNSVSPILSPMLITDKNDSSFTGVIISMPTDID